MWQLMSQTDSALNVDIIVMMALVTVQLLTDGMKFVEKLILFWHSPLSRKHREE